MLFVILMLVAFSDCNIEINDFENDTKPIYDYLLDVVRTDHKNGSQGLLVTFIQNAASFPVDTFLAYLQRYIDAKNAVINVEYSLPTFFGKLKNTTKCTGDVNFVFIFLESNLTVVENTLLQRRYFCVRNTRVYTIFVLQTTPTREWLIEALNTCWKYQYLNVLMVYMEDGRVRSYTYNPFRTEDEFLVDVITEKYRTRVFHNKVLDVNGFVIRVLFVDDGDITKIRLVTHPNGSISYGGKDSILIKELIDRINGTMEVVKAEDYLLPGEVNPWRDTNRKIVNATENKRRIISEQNIKLLFNSENVVNLEEMVDVLEAFYPHAQDDLTVIVPKARPTPYYLYISLIFKKEMWLAILLGYVIFVAAKMMITCSTKAEWLESFRSLLGGSLPKLPKTHPQRIILAFWLIFVCIICTAFQSQLMSVLAITRYESDIDTLEELNRSGLMVMGFRTQIDDIRSNLVAASEDKYRNILSHLALYPDEYDTGQVTIYNASLTRQAFVTNEDQAHYLIRLKAYESNAVPSLHVVKESIVPSYISFQAPTGSFFFPRFEQLLNRFQESGLIQIWKRQAELTDADLNNIQVKRSVSDAEEFKKLNLIHLQTAFFILAIGLSLSLIVFAIEMYVLKIVVLGRKSDISLYNDNLVSMDCHGDFTPESAAGFIDVHSIRLTEYHRFKSQFK